MEGCKWLHGHVSLEEHRLANIATNLHHCLGPWSPMVLISGSRTGGVDSWGICARAICCMAWEMGGMDGRKWFQGHVSFAQHLVAHTATNLRHRLGPWSPMVRDVAWGFGARGKCCKASEMGGMDGHKWLLVHVCLEEHLLAHTATNLGHRLRPRCAMILISGLRTGRVAAWLGGRCERA
jgi:hypothetical protein